MTTTVFNVPDISCEHCERTITRALTPLAGIHAVRVDIPTHQVRVDYDERQTSLRTIEQVLEAEDYPVASTA